VGSRVRGNDNAGLHFYPFMVASCQFSVAVFKAELAGCPCVFVNYGGRGASGLADVATAEKQMPRGESGNP
jgi:hypothetical protein